MSRKMSCKAAGDSSSVLNCRGTRERRRSEESAGQASCSVCIFEN